MAARQTRGKPPARARRRAPAGTFSLDFEGKLDTAGPGGRFMFVEVPAPLLAEHAVRGPLAVRGTLDGQPVDTELVPDAGGRYCLGIDAGLRRALGKNAGDSVRLALEAGTAKRTVVVPEDLSQALERDEEARGNFGAWSTVDRENLVRFVEDAPDAASRRRRISQALERLARNQPLA